MFKKNKKEESKNPIDKITITKASNGWLVEISRANDMSINDKVFIYSEFSDAVESLTELNLETDD